MYSAFIKKQRAEINGSVHQSIRGSSIVTRFRTPNLLVDLLYMLYCVFVSYRILKQTKGVDCSGISLNNPKVFFDINFLLENLYLDYILTSCHYLKRRTTRKQGRLVKHFSLPWGVEGARKYVNAKSLSFVSLNLDEKS